ncbi:UDP-glucosyltransferase 2 [Cherax quadricarinatus]|uniref:UDP-glucosyltransferase 2 n=1 Tax=Cherax quadricarinatus TaxID=27406 RepID=UPI00387E83E6
MQWWVAVLVSAAVLQTVLASKILFLAPISSRSHKNFYMAIINTLADDNNQVTIVTPIKPSKERNNVREVVLTGVDLLDRTPNMFTGHKMSAPLSLLSVTPVLCSDALAKEEVQNLLKEDFDLVLLSVFMSDCFLSLIYQMKVPFVYVNPAGLIGPLTSMIGNPRFPSYDASPILAYKHPMTFMQRAISTLSEVLGDFLMSYVAANRIEEECRKRGLCPPDMPSLSEIRLNASLLLINSVLTIDYPARPIVPAVVNCGGIHLRPAQPLPKDLEDWVQGAGDDGFIFFSLGSAVTPSDMPEEYRTVLIQVFASLKQRVLWKWDKDTMDDLPPNVRLGKWLPQQDILGDPRLRLFITHGGLLSTLESMYNGVSVLGMPVFGDQQTNMIKVQRDGWGKVLFWDQLTFDNLKNMINSVMNDTSMKTEVATRSKIMIDRPQEPAEVALYWIKYVIRHQGAYHLRCPAVTMTWYELYNVDVWATVVVLLVIISYVSVRLIISLCSWLFSKSKAKTD